MSNTISELNIKTFRGIHDLSLKNLSTINVFVGVNNTGKTSVLEAIKLISSPEDVGNLIKLSQLRADSYTKNTNKIIECISTMLTKETEKDEETNENIYTYNLNITAKINENNYQYEVSGYYNKIRSSLGDINKAFSFSTRLQENSKKAEYKTHKIESGKVEEFDLLENKLFDCIYAHSKTAIYRTCITYLTETILKEQKEVLLTTLKMFDKNIEDILVLGDDIYIQNKFSGIMPLFTYGAGMQKAIFLSTLLNMCNGGVVLVDEVDNTINASAFKEIFGWFIDTCKNLRVQAFITTHSMEAVDAILEYAKNNENDDIRIITLRKDSELNKTRALVRTGFEAYSSRKEFEMELRV